MTPLSHRIDFVMLFDVRNGNPNGDPEANNMPRMDPDTGCGLVSDVSLKRKIRNYVTLAKQGEKGFGIYVQDGAVLNERHREAYLAVRPGDAGAAKEAKLNPRSDEEALRLRDFMCRNFFDVRTFGAVMSTGINAGQVRGPVQITFAESIEPILPQEIAITRAAVASAVERREADERVDRRVKGRKYIVPYALYRAHGFVSAKLAERTGFSEADLDVLREALAAMFDHDRSAARGEMTMRAVIAFRHASALGNAPAHALFERVCVRRVVDGARVDPDLRRAVLSPARAFDDYAVDVDRDALPRGVAIENWV